jgi:hypothetical protein
MRLAYLAVSNAFTVLRLLPMGDRDKDIEILALRHQITVLQRQLGTGRPRFESADRALLAALPAATRHAAAPTIDRATRHPNAQSPPGALSCAAKPKASSPATSSHGRP